MSLFLTIQLLALQLFLEYMGLRINKVILNVYFLKKCLYSFPIYIFGLTFLGLIFSCGANEYATLHSQSQNISILTLFGDSANYYSKPVKVVGYAVIEDYESIVLFPSSCFYDHGYTFSNSIALHILCHTCKSDKDWRLFYKSLKSNYHKKYILVEGIFSEFLGHPVIPFSIKKITRLEIWKEDVIRDIDDEELL